MADVAEVIQFIKFGLEQLSSQNGQHEFEHICRHLARKKICPYILPSTGPVQAGGDQGFDFESFRTFANEPAFRGRLLLGIAGKNKIAFTCSLEDKPHKASGKIQKDITKLSKSGFPIDIVYFFSSRDIPVARRHELVLWAKEKFNFSLEIFDRAAISELLSEPDVFWIANKYLNIPSEHYPRPYNEDEEYKALLDKWKKSNDLTFTFEEFEELKRGARSVYKTTELKQDLTFWIEMLTRFNNDNVPRLLRRKAIYEICVTSVIGIGELTGKEELIKNYFSDFTDYTNAYTLEDASHLLSFAVVAISNNVLNIPEAELTKHYNVLLQIIDAQLQVARNKNLKCQLLELKFFSQIGYLKSEDTLQDLALRVNNSITYLHEIIDNLDNAPLYPLERLSDNLRKYIAIYLESAEIFNITELENVARIIDEKYLSKRFGDFRAAESCAKRAAVYFNNEKIYEAINLLQTTKINWFAKETLKGSILSMILLSECYNRLGMNYAAKYYGLAAADMAINSNDFQLYTYFPQALLKTANAEYAAGCWIGYLDMTISLLKAGCIINENFLGFDSDSELMTVIYYVAVIKYFDHRLGCELGEHISNRISDLPPSLQSDISEVYKNIVKSFDEISDEEHWNNISTQIRNKPFNDTAMTRDVSWKAFGIDWNIQFNNDYDTVSVAEQFLSILQIILVDFANDDLHNIRGHIYIKIDVSEKYIKPTYKRAPNNTRTLWNIKLPTIQSSSKTDSHSWLVSFAISMLYEFSLLKEKAFNQIVESKFKSGLSNKTFSVRTYENLYREYVSREDFSKVSRVFATPFSDKPLDYPESELLMWKSTVSPLYTKVYSEERIVNRYRKAVLPIELTLTKVKSELWFKNTIRQLREEGWLDWHILMAAMNSVVNYKANISNARDHHRATELFFEIAEKPEKDTYIPIPNDILSKENLRRSLGIGSLTIAETWGLQNHSETPNMRAITELLCYRFALKVDDIPHEQYLD